MFNEAIKAKIITISAALLAGTALLTSCGDGGEKARAEALLAEVKAACDSKNYELALTLADSLKRAYPKQIDARREALHLASTANEGLNVSRLERADSLVCVLGVRGDSLRHLIKYVENPIEGYYVAASVNPSAFIGTNGIQARVTPGGDFYLISSLKAKVVKSTSVSVSAGGASASTTSVAYDGERNDRSMGAEAITFLGAECDTVGRFVAEHLGAPMTLTFTGAGSYSMPLPSAQAEEVALMYRYATTIREFKLANIEKERLTRALDISRRQSAQTFVEKDSLNR